MTRVKERSTIQRCGGGPKLRSASDSVTPASLISRLMPCSRAAAAGFSRVEL